MLQRIHFAMQTYRRNRAGDLIKATWSPCETAEEARRRAELAVVKRKSIGAVAVFERNSGEFEEGEGQKTFAAFGEVPPEAQDLIPF